ncbi:MAG: fumarylacetoacetate hydrolase family protein [Myxococcales bacterium]|nr:fumarylacetoacetate hydrolase family protein [Myxococcales bacterium]
MEPSEQVNLPMWQGQPGHFEIWFVVAIDLDAARATWVRYTTFSPVDGPARAAVWAADFDATRDPPAIWAKSTHAIEAYLAQRDHFSVRIGDSEIRHGACSGKVASAGHAISWDLAFHVGTAPVRRTPAVLEQVRMATTAVHACADAPVTGWVEVDGVRRELARGKAVQMHLYGTRRVDNLSWIWAPALAQEQATLEVISAQMRRSVPGVLTPHMTSLFLRYGDELEDLTQLPDALLPSSSSPAPGVLDVTFTGMRRALRIRGFAPVAAYAGWVYRHTAGNGHELHVAQSDIASCVVESFRRSHPLGKWRPHARLVSRQQAAVELHGYAPIEGVRYVGWDETEPLPVRPAELSLVRAPLSTAGKLVELPPPTAIVAAGLTFAGHRDELGLARPAPGELPQMFAKEASCFCPRAGVVAMPSYRALCQAADAVEPGLGAALRARYPTLPVLLDYEVEIAIAVLEPASARELAAGKLPRLGYCLVNDLTARALQLLGEGQPSQAEYWRAAKSFPDFLPAVGTAWVPTSPADALPKVNLRTLVNGQVRQEALSTELLFRPSQLLTAAAATLGRDLGPGDLVLTGTPAGVALRAPRWKRRLSRMLDRFGKLDAAVQLYVEGAGFLRCGDRVTVDAEVLGARTIEIGLETEA